MALSERKEAILFAIIEHFISTGEPVGSKFLAATLPEAVSSATVRNEMAFLANEGFLDQPHTSAGRIPSDKGYRYYIDRLLRNFAPSDSDVFRIMSSVDRTEGDAGTIISQTAEALSKVTGCTVAASTPAAENAVIKNIQLIPVTKRTAMLLLNTSAGTLKNRVTRTDSDIDYSTLELFYNATTSNFSDRPAAEITKAAIQSLTVSLGERALDLAPLLAAFYDCASASTECETIVKGQANLYGNPETGADASVIISLLEDPEKVGALLKTEHPENAVELKIGAENTFSCMRRAAVVKSAYKVGDTTAGTMAVIGPTKMDYSRIIPLLRYVCSETGKILTDTLSAQ